MSGVKRTVKGRGRCPFCEVTINNFHIAHHIRTLHNNLRALVAPSDHTATIPMGADSVSQDVVTAPLVTSASQAHAGFSQSGESVSSNEGDTDMGIFPDDAEDDEAGKSVEDCLHELLDETNRTRIPYRPKSVLKYLSWR